MTNGGTGWIEEPLGQWTWSIHSPRVVCWCNRVIENPKMAELLTPRPSTSHVSRISQIPSHFLIPFSSLSSIQAWFPKEWGQSPAVCMNKFPPHICLLSTFSYILFSLPFPHSIFLIFNPPLTKPWSSSMCTSCEISCCHLLSVCVLMVVVVRMTDELHNVIFLYDMHHI